MDVNTTLPDAIQIIREARWAIVAVYSIQIYEWFATSTNPAGPRSKSRISSVGTIPYSSGLLLLSPIAEPGHMISAVVSVPL
ncbi:hypothetical protein C0992_006902, partial [Termitomyces sp. T32_za158]